MVLIFSLGILYPFIESIINLFSGSILLFNGVIIPVIMKTRLLRMKKPEGFKVKVAINQALVGVLIVFMVVGTYFEIRDFNKEN